MASDLGGPEKPLPIDWTSLLQGELKGNSPIRATYAPSFERVRPRHRIAVMLHETGWTGKQIAAALGYTESRVSVILNSRHPKLQELRTKFASQVADNAIDTQSKMKLYANEMLDILVSHARNIKEQPALSRLAARDILHMAGFTPVKKVFEARTTVPFDELKGVVGQLQDANEVVLSADKWSIKDPAA